MALWTHPIAVARMTKLTDLRSHLSRLSLKTFLEDSSIRRELSRVLSPGVEDGEEQGPPLLLRHDWAGDVEDRELGEARPEDVWVHPGEAHTVEGELLYICPYIGDLAITVHFKFIPPSLRTFVSSPVNCLFEMTVPINLTELRVLMTFVKTVSVTPEILTCPSNSSSLRIFSFLRWSNRDVA